MTDVLIRPTRAKKASTILRKAKELLEEENVRWCKNTLIKGKTRLSVCAIGALESVTLGVKRVEYGRGRRSGSFDFVEENYPGVYWPAEVALEEAARERAGEEYSVPDFNDDRKTTKKDVLRLFERAIEIAKEKERS